LNSKNVGVFGFGYAMLFYREGVWSTLVCTGKKTEENKKSDN